MHAQQNITLHTSVLVCKWDIHRRKPQYFLAFLLVHCGSEHIVPLFSPLYTRLSYIVCAHKAYTKCMSENVSNPYCFADRKSDIRSAGPTAWGRFKENNQPARGDEFFILRCALGSCSVNWRPTKVFKFNYGSSVVALNKHHQVIILILPHFMR